MNLRARKIISTTHSRNGGNRCAELTLGKVFSVLLISLFLPLAASALPLHTGDINTDEMRNVLDVNCMISSALSQAQSLGTPPGCQTVSNADADMQCDDSIDVTDVQRLTLVVLHTLTGDAEVEDLLRAKDHDLDYIHNDCDPDDDNDLYPDLCEIDNQTNPFNNLSVPLIPNACTCPEGCIIDEVCTSAGTVNAQDQCLVCDPYMNPFGWSPASDIPCDDGDECTSVDSCSTGSCIGAVPLECDDGNPCTDNTCDASLGCVATTNSAPCADGNACTTGDQCDGGVCIAGESNAACEDAICALSGEEDDEVICPIRVVRELQGAPAPASLQFSLGYDPGDVEFLGLQDTLCILNLCAEVDVPPAALDPSGHSVAMSPQSPEDWLIGGSVVIFNTASPETPLSNAYLSAGFVTGDAEVLQARFKLREDIAPEDGALIAISNALASTSDSESLLVSLMLSESGPVLKTGQPGCNGDDTNCDDANPCTSEICDPSTNACVFTDLTGPACTDNDACTFNDFCDEGSCAGTPLNCNDGTSCTNDSCDPASGCVFEVVVCDDGNPCTDDTCDIVNGCVFENVSCDDGVACTIDSCDANTGNCSHDNSQCGCQANEDCDDGNFCTINTCKSDFTCALTINSAASCDDDEACTTNDICLDDGTCSGSPVVCDDGDACTSDACEAGLGCVATAISCDDGDACTADSCDPVSGCESSPIGCDDGDACTTDSCDSVLGCQTNPVSCDDGDACTTNSCDSVIGCETATVTCDDGDACTDNLCDASSGCTFQAIECDDGNPCTANTCAVDSGCQFTPSAGAACNDGNPCTSGDLCTSSGECSGVVDDLICDDGDPCTLDSCDSSAGCSNDLIEGCSGGLETLLCTVSGGAGDEVVCTVYVARSNFGSPEAAAVQFDIAYDDSLMTLVQFEDTVCVGGDNCFAQAVPPGALSPSGHTAAISPSPSSAWSGLGTIILSNASDGLAPLTTAYVSDGGTLVGDAQAIDIRFSLNSNVIVPANIQLFNATGSSPTAKPMNGLVDTGVVVFSLNDCNDVGDEACDDGNPCTLNFCEANGTCGSSPANECDDGNPCTENDLCTGGICAGTPADNCDDGDICTVDDCDEVDGCVYTPGICADGNPCTTDICDANSGCDFLPIDCDDADPCTDDSCDPLSGQCTFTPSTAPECQSGTGDCAILCAVTGNAGETFDCDMKIASFDDLSAPAAALEFNMSYNASILKVDNFYAVQCFGGSWDDNGVCDGFPFEMPVTGSGSQPLPSGHSLTLLPTNIASWVDGGAVVMTPATSPPPPIGAAYCENGDGEAPYSEDTKFMTLRLELLADAPPGGEPVCLSDMGGATAVPITLSVELNGEGVFITSE